MSLLYGRIGHTRHVKCWTHHSHVWAIRNESRALHARESHNKWSENADFLTPRGQWTSENGVPLGFRFVAHTKVRSPIDKDTWNTATTSTRRPYLMGVHYAARIISESKYDCFLGCLQDRYWWCLALLWIFSPIVYRSITRCSIYFKQDVSMPCESFIYDTFYLFYTKFHRINMMKEYIFRLLGFNTRSILLPDNGF